MRRVIPRTRVTPPAWGPPRARKLAVNDLQHAKLLAKSLVILDILILKDFSLFL